MLMSLESFLELRREYGLSLRQTRETITQLALALLRDYSGALPRVSRATRLSVQRAQKIAAHAGSHQPVGHEVASTVGREP